MFHLTQHTFDSKTGLYGHLESQLRALLESERDFIANAANFSSFLYYSLPDLNWTGVYRLVGADLVLGPFQGKPACSRIPVGKGVCGAAAKLRQTVLVPNVHEFPGHIACDTASNSEIVLPLVVEDILYGVLDLDSPILARFDREDQQGLESLRDAFVASVNWQSLTNPFQYRK